MIFKKNIKKIAADSFISRLRCSVIGEGMLHEGNIYLMDFAIQHMPEKGIVFEIGCYGGLSTNLLSHLLKKHNKKNHLYGCDAWIYEGFTDSKGTTQSHIDGREDINRKDYMNYIKEAFIKSTQLLHPNNLPYTCHLRSDDFFKNWNSNNDFIDVFGRSFKMVEKIAFAYIDGDHSYEQTKKDFENIDAKLLKNGFILLDDSAKKMTFGSARFVNDILRRSDYKLIEVNPNYLFKKIK